MYASLCEDPERDPSGAEDDMIECVESTMSFWDTSAPDSKNSDDLQKDVLLDLGIANGMNGGIGVFVETTDHPGGTLQVLHNICPFSGAAHQGTLFAYPNGVQNKEVEVIPFQQELLSKTDEVIVPATMECLL